MNKLNHNNRDKIENSYLNRNQESNDNEATKAIPTEKQSKNMPGKIRSSASFLGKKLKNVTKYITKYIFKIIILPYTLIKFIFNKISSRKIDSTSEGRTIFANSFLGTNDAVNSLCSMINFDLDSLKSNIPEEQRFNFNIIKQDYLQDDTDARKILEFVHNLKLNYSEQKYFTEIKDKYSSKLMRYFQDKMGPTILGESSLNFLAKKALVTFLQNLPENKAKNAKITTTDIFTNLIFYTRYKKEYDKQMDNKDKQPVNVVEVINKAGDETIQIIDEILKDGWDTKDYVISAKWLSNNDMTQFDSINSLKTILTTDNNEKSAGNLLSPQQKEQLKSFILDFIIYAISKNDSINSNGNLIKKLENLKGFVE